MACPCVSSTSAGNAGRNVPLVKPNIVEIVSRYIELKRRGRLLVGRCPFHEEKDPSFTVDPDRGKYCCYGCGAKGDAIDFFCAMEKISFKEALDRLGIGNHKLSQDELQRQSKRKVLREAFVRWETDYNIIVAGKYRRLKPLISGLRNMEQAEMMAPIIHEVSRLEQQLDFLLQAERKEKFMAFRDAVRSNPSRWAYLFPARPPAGRRK